MTFHDIAKTTKSTILIQKEECPNLNIQYVVASDLMSDVLVTEEESFLLVTSLISDQIVRTADIVGTECILIVNGKTPQSSTINLAKENNISLLKSDLTTFEVCFLLGKQLEKEGLFIHADHPH